MKRPFGNQHISNGMEKDLHVQHQLSPSIDDELDEQMSDTLIPSGGEDA